MAKKGRLRSFLQDLFELKDDGKIYQAGETLVIKIPAALYYKELALHTAISLISNALSRSEIKVYVGGKQVKNADYYLLNISPNRNETSSYFWHRVINQVVRKGEALVVEVNQNLYCAENFVRQKELPVLGDVFGDVSLKNFTFDRTFRQEDCYLIRLDDIDVKKLIDGMYAEYGDLLSSAAAALKRSNNQKYKLKIEAQKAGDQEFQKEYEGFITEQLKTFMESDNAVYPEFSGYTLEKDPGEVNKSAEDYLKLKKEMMATVAGAMHIPDAMMTGNITNIKDIIASFLTFGVDPYADAITEALNKRGGPENFAKGNRYKVDTGKVMHFNIFDQAVSVSNLISSGVTSIDEVREELDLEPIGEEWSKKHFITKNFEEIEKFLKTAGEGGGNEE